MTCNKSSHNGPIEPGMVSFERLASSPVGNAQFPLFWRIKEPQKGIFLSSPWESRQILPPKMDGQKLLYLYVLTFNFQQFTALIKWFVSAMLYNVLCQTFLLLLKNLEKRQTQSCSCSELSSTCSELHSISNSI